MYTVAAEHKGSREMIEYFKSTAKTFWCRAMFLPFTKEQSPKKTFRYVLRRFSVKFENHDLNILESDLPEFLRVATKEYLYYFRGQL